MRGGVNGEDREAERGGAERASCLARWLGTDRQGNGPGAERGPRPQRPAALGPGGRWSTHLSSSLTEPRPPEEAAAPT